MTSFIKEAILAFLIVAAAIFAFWLWKETMPVLTAGILHNYQQFIAPIVALIAAASLFSMGAIFIDTKWLLYLASGVAVGAPFLLSSASTGAYVLLPGSILLTIFAARRIRKEHVLSIGFSTSKVLKAGLPLFFTAASLVASWFYLQTLTDQNKAVSALIPRPVSDLMIRVLAQPLKEATGLPDINPDITIDELLTMSVETQLEAQGVSLTAGTERGLSELLAHQRDQLARQYGIPLEGSERLGEVLNRAIIERLEDLLGPFVQYLPLLSAFAFFFAFKALTFPLYFMSVALTAGLIRALRMATIITIESQQIEVERLTL